MGKFLMYLGFFVALWAIGMMIVEVECDFGAKVPKLFTSSVYIAFFSLISFLVGEFLESRRKKY